LLSFQNVRFARRDRTNPFASPRETYKQDLTAEATANCDKSLLERMLILDQEDVFIFEEALGISEVYAVLCMARPLLRRVPFEFQVIGMHNCTPILCTEQVVAQTKTGEAS
jgi:hypothetical protein